MHAEDLATVTAIEQSSQLSPWTAADFQKELGIPHLSRPVVAEIDDKVVGFVIAWYVTGEVQINNIAVQPDYRRQGIAEALLVSVFAQGKRLHCGTVQLEVRRSNRAAIKLYEKQGFKVTGVRPQYYADTKEDAILMSKALS